MATLFGTFERYLECHYDTVLGELIYCTPGALDRYKDIPFPLEMEFLAKLFS